MFVMAHRESVSNSSDITTRVTLTQDYDYRSNDDGMCVRMTPFPVAVFPSMPHFSTAREPKAQLKKPRALTLGECDVCEYDVIVKR